MRIRYSGVVHCIAECDDCEWGADSHKNALALAARHCDFYGHTVRVEQGLSVVYTQEGSAYHNERREQASGKKETDI